MSSAHDTDFSTDAAGDHLAVFGETVTHRPLGVAANDASITAIFDEREPERDQRGGRQVIRKGMLLVASSVSANVADQWVIRTLVWETLAVGTAVAGLIEVTVTRTEDETRTGPRTVL